MASKTLMDMMADPVFQIGMGIMGGRGSFNNMVSTGVQQGTANSMAVQEAIAKKKAAETAKQQAALQQIALKNKADPGQLAALGVDAATIKALHPKASTFQEKLEWIMNASPEELKTIKDSGMFGSGTNIKIGTGAQSPRPLSPEETKFFGADEKDKLYWTGKGELKQVPRTSQETKKGESFTNMMQNSMVNMESFYTSPQAFTGVTGALDAAKLKAATYGGAVGYFAQMGLSDEEKMWGADMLEFIAGSRGYTSGAAVPETEVQRDLAVFAPQPNDTAEMKMYRYRKMQERLDAVRGVHDPEAKRKIVDAFTDTVEQELKTMSGATKVFTGKKPGDMWQDDEYNYKALDDGTGRVLKSKIK